MVVTTRTFDTLLRGRGGKGKIWEKLWVSEGLLGFPRGSVVKNLPARARNVRDPGSVPESGRSPGGGNGNPLQYSCLKNPMDKGACQAAIHGAAKSQTRLSTAHTHTDTHHVYHRNFVKFKTFLCGNECKLIQPLWRTV